ncbi:MAG: hypothetical protein U0354_09145 [Candidatus Sericytochromatia bacterium]
MRKSSSNCYLFCQSYSFPKNISFGVLFNCLCDKVNYTIYHIPEFRYNREIINNTNLKGFEEISNELDFLICSSFSYPPALTFAREKFEYIQNSKEDFLNNVKRALIYYLDEQPNNNFFLSKAKNQHTGYLYKGQYYWIVEYIREDNKVKWVSDDYIIYEANVNDFYINDMNLLEKLNNF